MSIAQKIEMFYKNQIENIKKMKNSTERDLVIGSLVKDIGGRCISALSICLCMCRKKIKSCYLKFLNGVQIKEESRGRKSHLINFPNLDKDIEKVIEEYKRQDSSIRNEIIYVTISPKAIIDELENKYKYPHKFACYNTIDKILKAKGYKLHKIPKSQVFRKIPETNAIFENVHDHLEDVKNTDDQVAAISIDDKASKKIGKISDNGSTRLDVKALDHDTIISDIIKPFGILDIKTNETYVTCVSNYSSAKFKTNCIDEYISEKMKKCNLKKLKIFLDNGPENGGNRKMWLLEIVRLAIKWNIIIDLVYYPPYHSKYNKIERYWARLQLTWNKIITDTKEKAIECINKTTWNGIRTIGKMENKIYEKVKSNSITLDEIKLIDSHIIREEGIEKWSVVVTPYSN